MAIRNVILRFREQCGGESEMLPGQLDVFRAALQEVEDIEKAAFEYVAAGGRVERLHRDALLTLRRIADETRTRS